MLGSEAEQLRVRMRRPSLLAQFGIISFIVVAAQLGVLPLLDPATFPVNFAPLPDDERIAFQEQLASGTSLAGVTRVKVWNRQHWIVLSDNRELTGLPNRHPFSDRVTQAIAVAERSSSRIAVLLLDLDRFKVINDTLGHELSDQALRLVGDRISGRLRQVDSVARLGGDEFAVPLSNVSRDSDPVAVAEELAALLEEPITIGGLDLEVHGSIGVAVFPNDGQDAGTLLQRADVAMYTAKSAHSRVERYRPERDNYAAEKLAIATDVRRALMSPAVASELSALTESGSPDLPSPSSTPDAAPADALSTLVASLAALDTAESARAPAALSPVVAAANAFSSTRRAAL